MYNSLGTRLFPHCSPDRTLLPHNQQVTNTMSPEPVTRTHLSWTDPRQSWVLATHHVCASWEQLTLVKNSNDFINLFFTHMVHFSFQKFLGRNYIWFLESEIPVSNITLTWMDFQTLFYPCGLILFGLLKVLVTLGNWNSFLEYLAPSSLETLSFICKCFHFYLLS